ncbi:MAG: hypothetical protein HQM13_18575 [SAR324 cluster bacterium]|nr:hypothetical protein [SAR324 cluster bacterium]
MKLQNDWAELRLESGWEEMILEYAIDTFPYKDAFEYLPGYQGDEREFLSELIDSGVLKIGFYFEEMQEDLTIFYFLQIYDETYIVLGLDSEIQVEIFPDDDGIFQIDEEQYIDLHQLFLN